MKTFCFVQLYHISERGGGAEVQTSYLAEYLARNNSVYYICKSTKVTNVTAKTIDGVKIYMLPNYDSLSTANFDSIHKLLLDIKPDYVVERMSSSFGRSILKAKKDLNFKYVWICTDNESPLKFKTLRNYFKKLSFLKFLMVSYKALKIDLIRIASIEKADFVFSQNDTQEKLIREIFNRDSARMVSGHPKPKNELSLKERFENRLILWCANLGKHKRPEIFIDLAKALDKKNIECVMVGSHANKNYVHNLIKNKSNNLIVTGQLPFEESLEYFDRATIMVNTSISEGFSNTYIQSWLRGVPVIVFGADPSNTIKTKSLGFDVRDVNEALNRIDSLLAEYEQYMELSKHVKEYALNNHSVETMADNFLKNISTQ